VWDIATGKCLRTLQGHTDWVHFLALTPDSRTVVSGGSDSTVRAWDVETGACVRTLQGHTDWVHHLTLAPDGRFAVSACRDRTLRVWDLATGECRHTLTGHTEYVEVVAVTPDGQSIVSASGDTTLRVWDLATGACRHTLRGHTNFVENLTITPDGKLALSASRDYTVRIWDLAAGTCVRTLKGHLYGITGVSVSPDGKLAISSSWDNTVRVWVIATGECLAIYHAGGRVPGTTMSLDGRIFCGASDGQLHFLRLRNRPLDRPLITAVRVFHMQGGEVPADSPLTRWLPFIARWLPPAGPYDRLPTALCPSCGQRFVPAAKVLDTISGIGRSAGLAPGKAPSLVLPPEAWNDAGLASECPQCKQRVQFNPFVVDSSGALRPSNLAP
jgi:WD40 repeat protein